MTLGLMGPPKLPPLPGERPPATAEPEPEPTTPGVTQVQPNGPTAPKPVVTQVQPTAPATSTEVTPTPVRAVPPAARGTTPPGLPAPPAPTPADPGGPQVMEPPQPEARGPAAEPTSESPPAAGGERGASRAPSIDPSTDERDSPKPFRLPPPQRPPYSGIGLFVGAGVLFSASLAEQIVAHVLIKRRCIEPFAGAGGIDTMSDDGQTEAEDFGQALLQCAPGVLPAVVLRVQSDIGLLATIGLASAGAVARARRQAYDDVFADRPSRRMLGLRIAGVGLIGTGVVTWLTTGAVSWSLLASCRDAKCATRARLTAFTTRDTGAVLIAAGAGMLAYSIGHLRAYDRFYRDRAFSVGTAILPGGAGLSFSGRF